MCVCVCVCVCVCACVCLCVCVRVWTGRGRRLPVTPSASARARTHTHTHTHRHARAHTRAHTRARTHTHTHRVHLLHSACTQAIGHVAGAATAVLGRDGQSQQTHLPKGPHDAAVKRSSASGSDDARQQLLLGKRACCLVNRPLFVGQRRRKAEWVLPVKGRRRQRLGRPLERGERRPERRVR